MSGRVPWLIGLIFPCTVDQSQQHHPHGVKFSVDEGTEDLTNTFGRSGSIQHFQSQPSFNDVPPLHKRETVVLEEGLPQLLRPKTEQAQRSHYRHELRRRLKIKNAIILFVCEFTGTFLFLFFSYGIATQASNRLDADKAANAQGPPDTSALLFSSLGFGFSLAVNAWVFFRITGSLFNPALTLGLTLLGNLDWVQCIVLSLSQYVASIAAGGLVSGLFPGPPNMRTRLGPDVTTNQGFWIEFFSTCLLLFTVFMLAGEKHKATFLAPIGIGLALFLAELLATKYTGGSLNPCRSLGADVAAGQFDHYAWIYYVAPYTATLFTTAFYKALVYFNYQTVVPDQDADEFGNQKQIIRDAYGNMIGALDVVPADAFGFMTAPQVDMEAEAVRVPSPATRRPGAEDTNMTSPSQWNDGVRSTKQQQYQHQQQYGAQHGPYANNDTGRRGSSTSKF